MHVIRPHQKPVTPCECCFPSPWTPVRKVLCPECPQGSLSPGTSGACCRATLLTCGTLLRGPASPSRRTPSSPSPERSERTQMRQQASRVASTTLRSPYLGWTFQIVCPWEKTRPRLWRSKAAKLLGQKRFEAAETASASQGDSIYLLESIHLIWSFKVVCPRH